MNTAQGHTSTCVNNGTINTKQNYVSHITSIQTLFRSMKSFVTKRKFNWRQRYYFYIHIVYIIFGGLFSGILLYLIELNHSKVRFVDAMFTTYSSITLTGLSSFDITKFRTVSLVLVLIIIWLGGFTVTTLPALWIKMIIARKNVKKQMKRIYETPASNTSNTTIADVTNTNDSNVDPVVKLRRNSTIDIRAKDTEDILISSIELASLKWLFVLIVTTSLILHVIGFVTIGLGLQFSKANDNGVNAWWSAFFLTVSGFNNCGFALYPDNLVRYSANWPLNIGMIFIMLLGNTMFPIFFRIVIYLCYRIARVNHRKRVFKYILDHHHHLVIHLFPSLHTKIYGVISIILITTGILMVIAMDFNVLKDLGHSSGTVLLIATFQTVSTRSSGFNTVDLSVLSVATITVYIVMMRVKAQMVCNLKDAAYSIAKVEHEVTKTKENTKIHAMFNTYGLFTRRDSGNIILSDTQSTQPTKETKFSILRSRVINGIQQFIRKLWYHTSNLLLRNNMWLLLVIIVICMTEVNKMRREPLKYSFLKVVFEVVSAFGNVGLTLGFPGVVYSFSGALTIFSKLLIICVMILGRHRGLYGSMIDQEYRSYIHDDTAETTKATCVTTTDNSKSSIV
jgi:Trk-type K+ transport system membrane component